MNIAIIKTGGKQYLVEEGSMLTIEKTGGKKGDSISFDSVLMTDDGNAVTIGAPSVSGAKIPATIVEEGRGKKITVVKYKAKSRYYKKRGHRQPFMRVKIGNF
ncbi:MAG: 50S ribosomal protein L21 [Patescibacteria group bacterium]|nr:50S ribosomal protein L21 [Patescibacteria group bacterium]